MEILAYIILKFFAILVKLVWVLTIFNMLSKYSCIYILNKFGNIRLIIFFFLLLAHLLNLEQGCRSIFGLKIWNFDLGLFFWIKIDLAPGTMENQQFFFGTPRPNVLCGSTENEYSSNWYQFSFFFSHIIIQYNTLMGSWTILFLNLQKNKFILSASHFLLIVEIKS